MSTLIPQLSISEFKKLKVYQMKELKSCEIYSDGQYLFTFVNGNTDSSGYLRQQSEGRCQVANAVGGKTLQQILG